MTATTPWTYCSPKDWLDTRRTTRQNTLPQSTIGIGVCELRPVP